MSTSTPNARASRAAFSAASSELLWWITTCAPWRANSNIMARPTRRAAPVTQATLSCRSSSMLSLLRLYHGAVKLRPETVRVHQHNMPAIRVREGHTFLRPVGVARWNRAVAHGLQPCDQRVDDVLVEEIEDQEIIRGRRRAGTIPDVLGDLQVVAAVGQAEHHAVVAAVILVLIDHGQTEPIAVKGGDPLELSRRPRNAELNGWQMRWPVLLHGSSWL